MVDIKIYIYIYILFEHSCLLLVALKKTSPDADGARFHLVGLPQSHGDKTTERLDYFMNSITPLVAGTMVIVTK